MFTAPNKTRLRSTGWLTLAALMASCVTRPTVSEIVDDAPPLASPGITTRPTDDLLHRFGDMLLAYRATDEPVTIGIDYIPNDSGIAVELPTDLGFYVESVMDTVGVQLRAVRGIPATAYVNSFGVATLPRGRTASRPVDYRVQGCILRASEIANVDEDIRADIFATRAPDDLDTNIAWGRFDSLVNLRVLLTLTDPNGNTLPGCSVTYDIDIYEIDDRTTVGFFISGSGGSARVGKGIADDIGNALQDATAACMIHLIGNALEIPYDRLGKPFAKDRRLAARHRDNLGRMTRNELEREIRTLMFAKESAMVLDKGGISADNPEAVLAEILGGGRVPSDYDAWIDFAQELWLTLPYLEAAQTIEDRLASRVREARAERLQANEQAIRQEAELKAMQDLMETRPGNQVGSRQADDVGPGPRIQVSPEMSIQAQNRALDEAMARQRAIEQAQVRARALEDVRRRIQRVQPGGGQ